MAQDYYAILGVTVASEDVVLDAARKALLRKYHPDVRPGEAAAARSRLINEAFRVLGDPASRLAYDRALAQAVAPPPAHLRQARERDMLYARDLALRNRRRTSRRLTWFLLIVVLAAGAAALLYDDRGAGYRGGHLPDAALEYFCRS